MKNFFLFFLTVIFIPEQVFCQNVINYDFKLKTLTIGEAGKDPEYCKDGKLILKYNKSYILKISNIDSRIYGDFSINLEERDLLQTDVPPVFEEAHKLKMKTDSTPGKTDQQNKLIGSSNNLFDEEIIKSNQIINENSESIADLKKKLDKKSQKVYSEFQSLPDEKKQSKSTSIGNKHPELKKLIDMELTNIYLIERNRWLAETRDLYLKIYKDAKAISDGYRDISNLIKVYDELVKLYNSPLSDEDLKKGAIKIESDSNDLLSKRALLLVEFFKNCNIFKEDYKDFTTDKSVKEFLDTSATIKIDLQMTENTVNEEKSAMDTFNKNDGYSKLLEAINTMLARLKSGFIKDICFGDIIKPTRDQMIINIHYGEIDPKTPKGAYSLLKKIPLIFDISGGAKISFSTGLLATTCLYNRKYSFVPTTATDKSIISEDENHSIIQPAVAGLMHVLWRTACSFTGGFTWGIGTNVSTIENLTIYVGGSLFIGRAERFVVSAGFATAPVNYLNGKYYVGQTVYNADLKEADLYVRAFRPGFFIGFSYNLTNQKSSTPVSPAESKP